MKRVIGLTAGLIALYLGVAYATGAGRLLREAGSAYGGVVRTLQGR